MNNIFDSDSASWEEGFSNGFNSAINLLKIAKKFEDTGFDADDILREKLKEIKKMKFNKKTNGGII